MMCLTMDAYPPTNQPITTLPQLCFTFIFFTVYNVSISHFYKLINSHVYVKNANCCENLRQLFIIHMFVLYLTKNCNSLSQ